MTRFAFVSTFAISLLVYTTQVFGNPPLAHADGVSATNNAAPLHVQYRNCPIPGHQHLIGEPCPILGYGLGNNFSGLGLGAWGKAENAIAANVGAAPAMAPPHSVPATVPMPAGPPPNGFIEGFFAPQRYQHVQPTSMYAPPQGQGNLPGYPPGRIAPPVPPQGQAEPQWHVHSLGDGSPPTYFLVVNPIPEQRVVYVPYAMPPPIQVERFAKTILRPPLMRRVLGNVSTYEYPEMPLQMYTTRGPRDFMMTNPPSIGY